MEISVYGISHQSTRSFVIPSFLGVSRHNVAEFSRMLARPKLGQNAEGILRLAQRNSYTEIPAAFSVWDV